jgi:hypothetical protein
MKLTKTEFEIFRSEIETALASVAAKYGCIVEAGNIKYDDINTTVSVSFKSETPDKSADQLNFEMYCGRYGFTPEDYGFTFSFKGKGYTFISFRPTARKYTCICECTDGKEYGFEAEVIHRFMQEDGIR